MTAKTAFFYSCGNAAAVSKLRILSLRPHENNPNILLLGEAFGLFVLFEYPNFNSKK